MKYIANILTDKKFVDNNLYNVVDDKNKLINNIPTLVIGWEYTKKMFPNANILNWEIDRNTFWTYGNREKRNRYEENLKKFREISLIRLIKSIKYEFKSVLCMDKEEKINFLNCFKQENANVYINNDMIYLLNDVNKVIGVSLRDIDYINGDRKKFLSDIYKTCKVISLNNDNIAYDIKIIINKYSYVVPYLFED